MNTVNTKALESTRLVVDLESTLRIVYECHLWTAQFFKNRTGTMEAWTHVVTPLGVLRLVNQASAMFLDDRLANNSGTLSL